MKDLCSIHITKECHEILQNLSKKYNLDMRKLANFCILQSAKEIQKDQTKIFDIFSQEKIQTTAPTSTEIIDAIFERVFTEEGRNYVFQSEVYKAVKPKTSADPLEIDKLGYVRYFPGNKNILAWVKS